MKSIHANACAIAKALGNENRLLVAKALLGGSLHVYSIEKATGFEQPVVSLHLAKLRACGVVEALRESQNVRYSLVDGLPRNMVELLTK